MTRKRLIDLSESVNNVTGTSYSTAYSLDYAETVSLQAVITVNTPAAATFTAAVTDICTSVASGFKTGLKIRGTTTTTLPAGLALATDYFVIYIDADTYKVASSLANALIGTAVDITNTGTGVHTFTPTAIAGGLVTLQQSNDGTNYSAVATGTAITASAVVVIEKVDPTLKYARVKYEVTAGQVSSVNNVLVKGETL